jgi:hypothetical protein
MAETARTHYRNMVEDDLTGTGARDHVGAVVVGWTDN